MVRLSQLERERLTHGIGHFIEGYNMLLKLFDDALSGLVRTKDECSQRIGETWTHINLGASVLRLYPVASEMQIQLWESMQWASMIRAVANEWKNEGVAKNFLEAKYRAKDAKETLESFRVQMKDLRTTIEGSERTSENDDLAIVPGGFVYGGKLNELHGRPLGMLGELLASRWRRLYVGDLVSRMAIDDYVNQKQVVADAATELRSALKQAVKKAGFRTTKDPLPSTGKGDQLCYILALPPVCLSAKD